MQYPKNLLAPVFGALKKLESQLLLRRAKLKAEDPFLDGARLDDNADDGTEAAEQYGHDQAEAMKSQTTAMLERVRSAMTRIEQGSYGQCVKCGNMIDTDRLGIDPTAEFCIKCATVED
mgnify:CR=1 FL=1